MKTIKKYVRVLEFFCIALIPFSCLLVIMKWFGALFPGGMQLSVLSDFWNNNNSMLDYRCLDCVDFWFTQRIAGFFVDCIALAIFITGLQQSIKILRRFADQEFFSYYIIDHITIMSKLALAWVLYAPMYGMLMSVITTLHKGEGNRVLNVSVSSHDLMNIALFCFLVILASVIKKGFALQQEHDLTV